LDVTENEVAKQIVDAACQVHTSLGPGLLESAYETVLAYELEKRGLPHGPAANGSHRLSRHAD
jgi:GxxExxY protein